MFLTENDPHHMPQDPNYINYFLILAVVLVAVMFYFGVKLLTYLDNRYERKNPLRKDSEESSRSDLGEGEDREE